MAEIKAGDLGLTPRNTQWKDNYRTLVMSNDIETLVEILSKAEWEERDYYYKESCSTIFHKSLGDQVGVLEYAGVGAIIGLSGVAGAGAAATLGATTTSWGLFGVTLFTTIAAAPVALVAGAGAGAAALGYGAYKLISSSAKDRGKEQKTDKLIQQGQLDVQPTRVLNPFIFSATDEIVSAYEFLQTQHSPNWQKFLELFDSAILNPTLVEEIRKSNKDDELKLSAQLRGQFIAHTKRYLDTLKSQYKQESQRLIPACVAFMEINNEFALPRLVQEERKALIDIIRKGEQPITQEAIAYEEFLALFSLYKMLLNHPQNTADQREKQRAKMHERARELGDIAEKVFDEIANDTRIIKLDHTNYLRYLREIIDVLDQEQARAFIETLLKDLAECMLVDGKLESYEQELLQGIIDSTHLQGTNLTTLLESYK